MKRTVLIHISVSVLNLFSNGSLPPTINTPTNGENAVINITNDSYGKKVFGKRLDMAKQIHVILPDDYNGTNYQPGETLLLIKYDKETWLEPIKKLTFSNGDVCEYDFTVIE